MIVRRNLVPIRGSQRPAPAAPRISAAPPQEVMQVTVHLRGAGGLAQHVGRLARQPAAQRTYLTRAEFAQRFGARPQDIAAVRRFAINHGLAVVSVHRGRRTVVLSGTVSAMSRAFGVQLSLHRGPRGAFRGRSGAIYVPRHLAPAIVAVLGLDTRPAARPHIRFGQTLPGRFRPFAGPAAAFNPPQVASLYGFPSGATGSGQCIALIELGGGFRPNEVQQYFSQLGVSSAPQVVAVGVDAATNAPTGNPNSADGEVVLDIEVAGSVAPRSKIAVYFTPNTNRGFADAILAAVHDQTNKPSVMSISWEGPRTPPRGHRRRVE